jgi:tryptophanyl-tRNA synthetase
MYDGRGYGDLKKDLAEVLVEFVKPIQERTRAYLDDPAQLDKILAIGAEKARAVSAVTLAAAYQNVGFVSPARGA